MKQKNGTTVIDPKETISENIFSVKGIIIVAGIVLLWIVSFYLFM